MAHRLLTLLLVPVLLSLASINDVTEKYHVESAEEIRGRLATYTHEKFSHGYHLWTSDDVQRLNHTTTSSKPPAKRVKSVTSSRVKRDGGLVSGPIATAVVTGMIGMTANTVRELTNFHPSNSAGGCLWFGTAPFCNYPCPPEYDYIRMNNGRCSNWWMSGFCVPDDSFGKPCSTLLGEYFYKRFCCKSDPAECSWSGRWMGANSAHNIYCRYDNIGRCGSIDCSINHFTLKAQNTSDITGDRCNRLNLFGRSGKATCGYIAWFDESGEIVDSWYKTRMSDQEEQPKDCTPDYSKYDIDSVPPEEREKEQRNPGRPDLDYDQTTVGPAPGAECECPAEDNQQ